jgi:hypothetical protein
LTLTDASALIALVNKSDRNSFRCRAAFQKLSKPLITTPFCFAEAMHLAYNAGGWNAQKALWALVAAGLVQFHMPNPDELARIAARF